LEFISPIFVSNKASIGLVLGINIAFTPEPVLPPSCDHRYLEKNLLTG